MYGGKSGKVLMTNSRGISFTAFFLAFFVAIPIILRTQPLNDPGASGTFVSAIGFWITRHFRERTHSPGAMPKSRGCPNNGVRKS